MPYKITTTTPFVGGCTEDPERPCVLVKRRAVATLDEARQVAEAACEFNGTRGDLDDARDLPEAGGTVGPLADGTTITVEPATWNVLACEPDHPHHPDTVPAEPAADVRRDILGAFNAAQGATS